MDKIINILLKLVEDHEKYKQTLNQHQELVKCWFDKKSSSDRDFQVGDLVLKWDKSYEDKGEDIKFEKLWCGPFIISKKIGPGCWLWSLIIFLIQRYYKVAHLMVEIM